VSAEALAPAPGAETPLSAVRRWPRRMAYGVAGLAVLLPSSTAGAAWYLAAQIVTPGREYPIQIRAVHGSRVTLTRTEDTGRSIPISLVWPGGHARLGPVLGTDRTTVVRELDSVTRGTCRAGLKAYTTSFVYDGEPGSVHGLDFDDVRVPGELGELPAWLVPGADAGTWVIAVHGRGAHRGEALRALPTIHAAGATALVVTYRNDEGAPASPDGSYHLGATEWRDLMAAVTFARERGARRIVLYGWSMGGNIALNLLRHGELAGVVALIMDSPVVDWADTLRQQAARLRLPAAVTWSALRLVEQRIGARLSTLDFRQFAVPVPTLLFVDGDDRFVAPGPAREFAAANPDAVRLVESTGGGHVRSWNVARERYETELTNFLTKLVGG
jgi:dienelactone hydrolase